MSPASDQSSTGSPVFDSLDQPTDGSSDAGQILSPAGLKIVVHDAEGTGKSFEPTEKTPEHGTTYKELENVHRSPSSSQDDSKPLGAPRPPKSPVEGSFIPKSIAYSLRFTFEFDGCLDSKPAEEHSVLLHVAESYQEIAESYQEIEKVADKYAKSLSAKSLGQKELKLFYGSCTLVSDQGTTTRLPLRSPEDWTKANERIVEYWISHTQERLHLCISRHYLASQEQPVADLAKIKNLEIHDLMKKTLDKKRYIPHNVLQTVISNQAIRCIIQEKPPKSLLRHDQHTFTEQVQAKGRLLFAMCVHARLKMECLKTLLDSGLTDSNLPLDKSSQCHKACRQKFEALLEAQGGFRAARFDEGVHQNFDPHTVVPLHFCPRPHGKNDTDLKGAALCGRGASSEVYCVRLNPNHHSLSEDLDACFALKILNIGQNSSQYFDREQNMLRELRKLAHAHVVTHLATWTQDGRHYIILPYAQCDLRKYMEHNTFAQKDALWLLDQFCGMAEAVRRIHNLSDKEEPTSNLAVMTSAPGERTTAWHHDIKPENILFFKDSCSSCGIFRLADWGSAKVNPYRTGSYNTRSPIGTLTYEPPEYTSKGTTSRPHDLWSLGCVFLELLVWAVFGWKHVQTFSDKRDGKRDANSGTNNITDDTFWQKSGNEYKLRQSVVTQLQNLDEELGKPGALPFKEVVGYTRRMLEIEAQNRIKAHELCPLLSKIILMKTRRGENPSDEVKSATQSSTPTAQQYPDNMAHESSPTGRSSYPAYAEQFNLSPSDMSPRASRHSRNSSASELMTSHATHSRQSSNASNHSTLSLRDRKGSYSSASSPRATEGGI